LDLKSQNAFWPIQDGLLATYPPLGSDQSCEVAILGAGITGALVANELTRRGMDVLVLDRREVAHGSTSATTALLQYEIDVHLTDLSKMVGESHARRAYLMCHAAIDELESIAAESRFPCGFERKVSVYDASRRRDVKRLIEEGNARREIGIEVDFYDPTQARERFGMNSRGLLVSSQAAACDAFALAHGLLQNCIQRGARVFDRTEATKIRTTDKDVEIQTDRGAKIRACHLVYASGYETQPRLLEKIVSLKSTYALVTQPLDELGGWNPAWIYWESARPYLYFRVTEDRRLLIGGEDMPFRNPARRDARVQSKSRTLIRRVRRLLPDIPLEAEYSWAGTFGETKDGLPFIGPHPKHSRSYFALGFGGNGITFSQIAARILGDLLQGHHNADAEIYRFNR